jgi:hypothetical protein
MHIKIMFYNLSYRKLSNLLPGLFFCLKFIGRRREISYYLKNSEVFIMSAENGINVQQTKRGTMRSNRWDFQETAVNPERVAENVKNKTLKFIEEATVRYLENFPQQSDRDPSVLWRLAFAYNEGGKKI